MNDNNGEERGRGRPRIDKRAEISKDLEELAIRIKKDYPDPNRWFGYTKTDVIFLECYGWGGADWLGRCRPVKHPWDAILPAAKYIIEFNMDRIEDAEFNTKQKELLMLHEMLHIPEFGLDENDRDFKKILKHEITDFSEVLTKAGIDYFDWMQKDAV